MLVLDEGGEFTPLLTTVNWNDEWKALQKSRKAADTRDFWNERSKTFGQKKNRSTYAQDFLRAAAVEPGDVVFDMGCGNGALAIPLARAGHKVIAADFSSGMLDALERAAADAGVADLVQPLQLSWNDPWDAWVAAGVREGVADVAFASRSIATNDLLDSLLRLDRVARKRCCITLSTGASPRLDEQILEDLGIQAQMGRDFLYAFNILAAAGVHPSVTYLNNARHDKYDSREEACASLERMLEDVKRKLPEAQHAQLEARFNAWVRDNLRCVHGGAEGAGAAGGADSGAGAEGAGTSSGAGASGGAGAEGSETFWQLSRPRKTQWAFISWNVGL